MTETIRTRDQAEGYVALVCFKHGPPRLQGLELEWIVQHQADSARPVELDRLRAALGDHAPSTVDPTSAHSPLPAGGQVTVEPGGQLELSTQPAETLPALIAAARADIATLQGRLSESGLVLGSSAADARPLTRRILRTPRYDALEASFDRVGPLGRQMMTSTASLQICLDAGRPGELALRWQALHALGPPLAALFANSPRIAGRSTGWASSRMRAVLGMAPAVTTPPDPNADPVAHWVRLVMEAPLVCVRRPGGPWIAPTGSTFADWIDAGRTGAGVSRFERPPTYADLDYHLSTLFPMVRPRGYLEVRYLDQQPAGEWVAPAVLLAALLATPATTRHAIAAAAPAHDRWVQAARDGLGDRLVRAAAAAVVDVGLDAIGALGLDPVTAGSVRTRLALLARGTAAGSTGGPTSDASLAMTMQRCTDKEPA